VGVARAMGCTTCAVWLWPGMSRVCVCVCGRGIVGVGVGLQ
jgi:hypothetical protein